MQSMRSRVVYSPRPVGVVRSRLTAGAGAEQALPTARALPLALLDQRPYPDDVARKVHGPERLRDAHAVGGSLDLEIAKARPSIFCFSAKSWLPMNEPRSQPTWGPPKSEPTAATASCAMGQGRSLTL
jgi:hypothetical protein